MTAPLPPLPAGFRVALDPETVVLDGGRALLGGRPRRLLRLTDAGADALRELRLGPVASAAAGKLARRLVSAGVAHPRPPAASGAERVTVIVPVRDRAGELDRCLAALGRARVVVVDDGSADAAPVAEVAARHGARLVTRAACGGPAAARNSGLEACGAADLVAFLDSDCVPPADWLDLLVAHLADPAVGAVAPRVVPLPGARSALATYAAAWSPLDLGPRAALVRPGAAVPYVPTAALVVRRTALGRPAFDEDLRYGEDVDAVWRMADAGWQVRYEPAVEVGHTEPASWPVYIRRRFRYGTSAGPLARRHPTRLAPVVLQPMPGAVAVLLLAARPRLAAAAAGVATARFAHALRTSGVPVRLAPRLATGTAASAVLGLSRAATQLALPALVAAAASRGKGRGRRLAVLAAFLAAHPVTDWATRTPPMDPLRWSLARLADEVAYGAGVWVGAARSRTVRPVLPGLRPRTSPPDGPARKSVARPAGRVRRHRGWPGSAAGE